MVAQVVMTSSFRWAASVPSNVILEMPPDTSLISELEVCHFCISEDRLTAALQSPIYLTWRQEYCGLCSPGS